MDKLSQIIGESHPDTLASQTNLGSILHRQGKHADAETIQRSNLAALEQSLGKDHVKTVMAAHNLALTFRFVGKRDEAICMLRVVIAQRGQSLGKDHPVTLGSVANLAALLCDAEQYVEAEALATRALAAQDRALGDPNSVHTIYTLGEILLARGRPEEAAQLLRDRLVQLEAQLNGDNEFLLHTAAVFGLAQSALGESAEAIATLRAVHCKQTQLREPPSADVLQTAGFLGAALARSPDTAAEGKELLNATCLDLHRTLGPQHPYTEATVRLCEEVGAATSKHDADQLSVAADQ
jgi:tetratricopeptide (TPR) repeat protein